MADVRAIAVCKGGPLDGQHISVLLNEDGSPPPLTSRAEIVDALYLPGDPIDLSDDVHRRFYGVLHGQEFDDTAAAETKQFEDHKAVFAHETAFEYLPHEFIVERDDDDLPVRFIAGAAL